MGPRYLCSVAAVDLEYGYPPSPIFSMRHYLREQVPFSRQGRQIPQRLRHQGSPPPIPAYSLFHPGLAAQPENTSQVHPLTVVLEEGSAAHVIKRRVAQ
jgi:hypothetical protein